MARFTEQVLIKLSKHQLDMISAAFENGSKENWDDGSHTKADFIRQLLKIGLDQWSENVKQNEYLFCRKCHSSNSKPKCGDYAECADCGFVESTSELMERTSEKK